MKCRVVREGDKFRDVNGVIWTATRKARPFRESDGVSEDYIGRVEVRLRYQRFNRYQIEYHFALETMERV